MFFSIFFQFLLNNKKGKNIKKLYLLKTAKASQCPEYLFSKNIEHISISEKNCSIITLLLKIKKSVLFMSFCN